MSRKKAEGDSQWLREVLDSGVVLNVDIARESGSTSLTVARARNGNGVHPLLVQGFERAAIVALRAARVRREQELTIIDGLLEQRTAESKHSAAEEA